MSTITYHSLLQRLKLESSAENTQLWTPLPKFPLGGMANPVAISHDEFVIAPPKSAKFGINSLYKYSAKTGKWTTSIKYAEELQSSSDHNIAFDADRKRLYIHNRQHYMLLMDLQPGHEQCIAKPIKFSSDPRNWYVNAALFVVDGQLHTVGGMHQYSHAVYDEKRSQFIHKYSFFGFQTGWYGAASALIDRGKYKMVLLFGGMDAARSSSIDAIYKYDLVSKKWNKSKTKLPKELSFIACVVTQDQKYVILLGGVCGAYSYDDTIYVYDIEESRMLESKVKCPNMQHKYGAVILSDLSNKEAVLLCSGYIRQMLAENAHVPKDIVSVVKLLYNVEWIHLMQWNKGTHWKILVADVITNATPV